MEQAEKILVHSKESNPQSEKSADTAGRFTNHTPDKDFQNIRGALIPQEQDKSLSLKRGKVPY